MDSSKYTVCLTDQEVKVLNSEIGFIIDDERCSMEIQEEDLPPYLDTYARRRAIILSDILNAISASSPAVNGSITIDLTEDEIETLKKGIYDSNNTMRDVCDQCVNLTSELRTEYRKDIHVLEGVMYKLQAAHSTSVFKYSIYVPKKPFTAAN